MMKVVTPSSAGANLPQSINYLPLLLGGALMALFAACQLVQAVAPPQHAAPQAPPQEGDL